MCPSSPPDVTAKVMRAVSQLRTLCEEETGDVETSLERERLVVMWQVRASIQGTGSWILNCGNVAGESQYIRDRQLESELC